jgi:D-sedoheptulose 7-phosphate isomerase
MKSFIYSSLKEAESLLKFYLEDENHLQPIDQAINRMVETLKRGGRLLSCGNGGSLCDAMHFAEELTGRYRKDRPALSAMALTDPSHLTCVSNDFGPEQVFSRLVDAWGRADDCLLTISTSGNSPNCILAAEVAKTKGIHVIGLLGKDGGQLKNIVDIPIHVPYSITDRIQEMHIKIIHILIEGIERQLFPEHYQ